MMPTRWIMVGMQGFAMAAAVGLAFALLGPVQLVRTLGWAGFALAALGALWHAWLLRQHDPHAWSVLRYRILATADRMGMQWSRARYALGHGARDATAANP